MNRRVGLSIAAVAIVASAIACVDLFHSTDVASLCDLDASAPGCDAAVPIEAGPPSLCAPDAGVAQSRAAHACTLLAGCEHPIGQNKTGTCMVNAILAYDCAANPNRRPAGAAKAFWECMQSATSCADVGECTFPNHPPPCANGGFLGCSQSSDNIDSRVDCVATTSAAAGENCAPLGQTCDSLDPDASNNGALCVGHAGRACIGTGCVSGRWLSLCDDAGIDHGVDCTVVGAGKCDLAGAACLPMVDSGTCSHTNAVTCTPGNIVAQGCAAGVPEHIDCTAISGGGTCVAIPSGASGTVPADACRINAGCTDDTCSDAGHLLACVRGRTVDIDCKSVTGLTTCEVVATGEGNIAACSP